MTDESTVLVGMGPYLKSGKDGNGNGLRVGYMVDDHEHDDREPLDARLPLLQHADLEDKVVLLRVDHNVVKKGPSHPHTFLWQKCQSFKSYCKH